MQVKCKPDSDEFDNIKIEKNFSAWQNYFKQSKKTNDYVRGKKRYLQFISESGA